MYRIGSVDPRTYFLPLYPHLLNTLYCTLMSLLHRIFYLSLPPHMITHLTSFLASGRLSVIQRANSYISKVNDVGRAVVLWRSTHHSALNPAGPDDGGSSPKYVL